MLRFMERVKLPPTSIQSKPNSKRSFASDDEHDSAATLVGTQEQGQKEHVDLNNAPGPSKRNEGDDAPNLRLAQEWENPILSASVPKREGQDIDSLDPPTERLSQFRDLFTGARCCSKCKKLVHSPRGLVRRPILPHALQTYHTILVQVTFEKDSLLPRSIIHLLHAPCASCGTNHCRGCWTPIPCKASCGGAPKKGVCAVTTCCAAVRAVAIFETLSAFDGQLGGRASSQSRVIRMSTASVGSWGTGCSTGGFSRLGVSSSASKHSAKGAAKDWDKIVVPAFNVLADLLPAPSSESVRAYDLVPHASVRSLLSLSKLPDVLASLLRNDSVTDWTARSEVYYSMLRLLRRMAECEPIAQVLFERRWEAARTPGLEAWMWGKQGVIGQKDQKYDIECSPPLYEYFNKLVKQGETFLTTTSHVQVTCTSRKCASGAQARLLCGDIIAAGRNIQRIMDMQGKTTGDLSSTVDKRYTEACDELAFKHVVLGSQKQPGRPWEATGLAYLDFFFALNITGTQDATRNPKNHFRLASDLAILATSLPPGVWVRVDEVRNDVMCASFSHVTPWYMRLTALTVKS